MMDDSILGNTLGQLGGVLKQTAQQVAKTSKDIVEGVPEQVSAKTEPSSDSNKVSPNQSTSDKDTKEVVKGMYARSDNTQQKTPDKDNAVLKGQPEFEKMMVNKTPEERKKLLLLHLERHKLVYADQLLHPPPKKPEERPAEKVEKEKMQDIQEEKKKEEKKPPALVQRARERVERFPGATG